MKKIISISVIILAALTFFGCNNLSLTDDEQREILLQRMIGGHEIYYADFGDFSGDEPIEEKIFNIVTIVRENVEYAKTPGEEYTLPNPKEMWERGYADCDGFGLILMNIMYVELGERPMYVATNLPDPDETIYRAIINGGDVSHGAIYLDGKVYEPQTGYEVDNYVINYLYPFEFAFSAEF